MEYKILDQVLLVQLTEHKYRAELIMLFSQIATVGKYLSREVNRAGIGNVLGLDGSENVHGEKVQKLDMLSHQLCVEFFSRSEYVAVISSEEAEEVIPLNEKAPFVLSIDPLDGSSNIDINVSIGTIFSVYEKRDDIPYDDVKQCLRNGREQILSGYVLYGSSTVLVWTFGDGVYECTLDQSLGEFILSKENLKMPEGSIYSINEANFNKLSDADKSLVEKLRDQDGAKARYIGALVADVHRTLLNGGVFLYPELQNSSGEYKGKLRLNYELFPVAMLVEQAGGIAVNSKGEHILDLEVTDLHQKSGVYLGNSSQLSTIYKQ